LAYSFGEQPRGTRSTHHLAPSCSPTRPGARSASHADPEHAGLLDGIDPWTRARRRHRNIGEGRARTTRVPAAAEKLRFNAFGHGSSGNGRRCTGIYGWLVTIIGEAVRRVNRERHCLARPCQGARRGALTRTPRTSNTQVRVDRKYLSVFVIRRDV